MWVKALRQEYEMLYDKKRHSVPHSLYGNVLQVMEHYHWTWDDYCNAPDDLVVEATIRLEKKRRAEARAHG